MSRGNSGTAGAPGYLVTNGKASHTEEVLILATLKIITLFTKKYFCWVNVVANIYLTQVNNRSKVTDSDEGFLFVFEPQGTIRDQNCFTGQQTEKTQAQGAKEPRPLQRVAELLICILTHPVTRVMQKSIVTHDQNKFQC